MSVRLSSVRNVLVGPERQPPPQNYLRADDDSDCFSYNIFSKKIDIYYFCLNCLNRVCQNNISFFGPNMSAFFFCFFALTSMAMIKPLFPLISLDLSVCVELYRDMSILFVLWLSGKLRVFFEK